MNRLILVLIFSFVVFCGANAQLQRNLSSSFTLDDCISVAMENNTDIKLANARLATASAELTSAFGAYLPSMGFNMGYSRQLNSAGGRTANIGGQIIPIPATDPNSYQMSAFAQYNIFNGFARDANYSRANKQLDANDIYSRFVYLQIKLKIYREYIDVIRKMQIQKIRQENLELGKKELERIQAHYEAGSIHIGVVYAQEAELGNREFELVTAENDLNIAKAVLLTTMGLRPELEVNFVESSLPSEISSNEIERFRREFGSLEVATTKALNNRLDFVSLNTSLEATQNNLTIAKSGYYPSLNAQGGWSWTNSQFKDFSELGRSYIGLQFSLPVFDNFQTNQQIQYAKFQINQQQLELIQLEQSIRATVQTAMLNLDASEKQLEITQRSLKSAERNYETNKERFQIGAASVTDYLAANNALIVAQINRTNAIYNYYQSQKEALFAISNL